MRQPGQPVRSAAQGQLVSAGVPYGLMPQVTIAAGGSGVLP
jgi:hypothetical protein